MEVLAGPYLAGFQRRRARIKPAALTRPIFVRGCALDDIVALLDQLYKAARLCKGGW